ncbi:hypothetical protein PG996_007677 [Apiospora saccharicola]|uniref:Uncharacterized protein n=1 Tax=Apiospora saccharicola TaxID=335842 RepID=A0ABR1VBI7_9PEZI
MSMNALHLGVALMPLMPLMASAEDTARTIREQLDGYERNITHLQTVMAPSWVSAQIYRSTASILWSCIVTLTACVYTALHLNISGKQGWRPRLLSKLKWVAVGLFIPEVPIYLAISQFMEARWVVKKLTALQRADSEVDQEYKFDLNYGFFVVMGGLQVSLDHLKEKETRKSRIFGEILDHDCRKTISAAGVVTLAQAGKFIYVSPDSITDRSKANSIQKSLVFIQIVWMALQCIFRHVYGLPLTLLEIHTLVHVASAFFMYCFWFKKPLDIGSTEIVEIDGFRDILNLLLLEYYSWDLIEAGNLLIVPVDGNNIPHYRKFLVEDKSCDDSDGALPNFVLPSQRKWLAYVAPERDADGNPTFVPPIDIPAALSQQDKIVLQRSDYLPCGLRFVARPPTLSKAECAALASAGDAYWRLGGAKSRVPEMWDPKLIGPAVGPEVDYPGAESVFENDFGECLSDTRAPFQHQSNILNRMKTRHSKIFEALWKIVAEESISFQALVPLSVIYGGLHCVAWNYHFPSDMEKYLWRFTCISLVVLIFIPFFYYLDFMKELKDSNGGGEMPSAKALKAVENIGAGCLVLGLLAFRTFIVVESFISLRALPVGAFMMPGWLQMIPHL